MHHAILVFEIMHGRWGYWDEILNALPVVLGIILLLYLYFARRRKHNADTPAEHEQPPK